MRASYLLPSGDYNLILSEEELQTLLDKGQLSIRVSRTPCVTGRGVWNPETKTLDRLDEKFVCNDLRFCLNETVRDIEEGFHNVQFLNIHVEKEEEK